MARYWVTSNAAEGFDGVFRGYPGLDTGDPKKDYPPGFGWKWPKKGIEVEVTDSEEDPKAQPQGEGACRTIGKRTYAALKGDSRIFCGPMDGSDDGTAAELAAAKAEIADLKAQLAAATAKPAPAPAHKGKDKGAT